MRQGIWELFFSSTKCTFSLQKIYVICFFFYSHDAISFHQSIWMSTRFVITILLNRKRIRQQKNLYANHHHMISNLFFFVRSSRLSLSYLCTKHSAAAWLYRVLDIPRIGLRTSNIVEVLDNYILVSYIVKVDLYASSIDANIKYTSVQKKKSHCIILYCVDNFVDLLFFFSLFLDKKK